MNHKSLVEKWKEKFKEIEWLKKLKNFFPDLHTHGKYQMDKTISLLEAFQKVINKIQEPVLSQEKIFRANIHITKQD